MAAQVKFTKDHEWVSAEGDVATCGITEYAQKAQGDPVAVVESAKAASEVYAPLTGEIVAVNDILVTQPGKVNAAAMGEGWFFKIKPTTPANDLMDESQYQNYVKGLG